MLILKANTYDFSFCGIVDGIFVSITFSNWL